MDIRTFQPGDEAVQAAIYNEAAEGLPRFKPALPADVARRVAAPDFDPAGRFYALKEGRPVGYVVYNANGRVSYPWCRKGHEDVAVPLFQQMLQALAERGQRKAFAAYRGDWPVVLDFFRQQGFAVVRDMVNFVVDIVDMPTIPARPRTAITPLERSDVPALYALAPQALRCTSAADLERQLFDNPYFPPSSAFVLRKRAGDNPLGVGVLIKETRYADPKSIDASMPCFRLGAFGTEGMQAKRVNGLFSFLCREDNQCGAIAVDLMRYATSLVKDADNITALAGQAASDTPHWFRFYQMIWRRQGGFPVLEKSFNHE